MLNSYINLKFFKSLLICITVTISIFYVFSLISFMGENFNFSEVLYLSLLNSLQIIFYIPGFIFFFTITLFWLSLKNHNELLIIKQYVTRQLICKYLLIFIILFTTISINKTSITSFIENIKFNITNINNFGDLRLIVFNEKEINKYYILKKFDYSDLKLDEITIYKANTNKILNAEYSNEVKIDKEKILAKNVFLYNEGFEKIEKKEIDINNIYNLLFNKNLVSVIKKKGFINTKLIFKTIIYFLLLYSITYIFLNKNYISNKNKSFFPFLISIFLILYANILTNITLSTFNYLNSFLGIFFFILIFFKFYRYD